MKSRWFVRSESWTILFLIGKRKPREMAEGGEWGRKDDNVVTREANLLGTLMDDPTTMKPDRPTERFSHEVEIRSRGEAPRKVLSN